MSSVKDSCLCGSVHFEYEAEPVLTVIGHCRHCQKASGTASSVNVVVPKPSLHVEGRTLWTFKDVGDSGEALQRLFCRNCGSPIVSYTDDMPELAFVKAGTLEDVSGLAPSLEIWCDSVQPRPPPRPRLTAHRASLPGIPA